MTMIISRRTGLPPLAGLLLFLSTVLCAPPASAFPVVGEPGEGAGQIDKPTGLAVDTESGRLYVADGQNRRVDAFNANTGVFEFAFGWGVKNGASELQKCTTLTTCRAGLAGAGAGQFNQPGSIAVDNDPSSLSHHDVYVYDNGNSRMEKFSPEGAFLLQLGTKGKAECEFAGETESGHPVAVGPGGTVYVANTVFLGGFESEGFKHEVEKFEPSGACIGQFQMLELQKGEYPSGKPAVSGIVVDSTGKVYASFPTFPSGPDSRGPSIHRFESDGTPLGPVGLCTFGSALGLDSSDDVFIACGSTVEELDSAGLELRVFGYGALLSSNISGLAHFSSASGELYAAERDSEEGHGRIIYMPLPSPGPIVLPEAGLTKALPIGNTKATLNLSLNPEGKTTKYHAEFITEAAYQENLEEGHEGFLGATRAPASAGEDPSAGSDFTVHETTLVAGCSNPTVQLLEEGKCLFPETKYRFRVLAGNADGEGNSPVEGEPFTTREPFEINATWSSGVGTASAVLNGEVNPLGAAASGKFEFITEAAYQENLEEGHEGFLGATATGTLDFGSGEEPDIEAAPLESLLPGTTYRYRLEVSDAFVTKVGPEHVFHTLAEAPGGLSDGRLYELVSPPAKNSGEVGVPTAAGGDAEFSAEPQQASPDGGKITYGSFTSFGEDPKSAPATSQYMSRLGPPFWTTASLNPRFEEGYLRDPLVGFSADLSHAAVLAIEPPLTEDATVGFPDLYVRDNETGALTAITTADHTPTLGVGGDEYCLFYGGASTDFKHVVFAAMGALNEGDPAGEGFNLYEWSQVGGLQLVSRLPNGVAATPKVGTGIGFQGGPERFCKPNGKQLRHAISVDGSRVFWTLEGTFGTAVNPLFARVDGTETLRLDEPNQGAGVKGGRGEYWDASTDGSLVFLTDGEKLTTDSTATESKPDLYLYAFGQPLHHRLTDLTVHAGEAANVQGVVGASEDGSSVYFVARAALAANQNPEGATAEAGKSNLYRWHEGQTRFVATLAGDASDWSSDPGGQTARVSPDGRHVAFLSRSSLTGYDNLDANGGQPDSEVFVYDSDGEGTLSCASCNPSGSRPAGASTVPTWSTPYQQPRYLSDDGARVFFQTLDSLDPHDTNGKVDVYEFERPGFGSCAESSPAFVLASGGCVYPISSGQSSDDSYLLDASSSGDGVFLSTRERLLPTVDLDERFDIYDARVGGSPPPPVPPACEGHSCPNGSTGQGPVPSPGTPSFQGPSNRRLRECPKGTHRVRRKGKERCVKSAKHKKHRRGHARRATGGAR